MRQVLQSGLLGQVFLLWLNLSPSIQNILKEVRQSSLKLSSQRQRPINHCFPRSSMTKTKGLRSQEGSATQQEVKVQRSPSLWLQVPGCPAGLRRNETHKEQTCAHVNTLHYASRRQSCSVCVIWPNNILVNVLSIIIQSFEFFHRRHRDSKWRRCLPCCVWL